MVSSMSGGMGGGVDISSPTCLSEPEEKFLLVIKRNNITFLERCLDLFLNRDPWSKYMSTIMTFPMSLPKTPAAGDTLPFCDSLYTIAKVTRELIICFSPQPCCVVYIDVSQKEYKRIELWAGRYS